MWKDEDVIALFQLADSLNDYCKDVQDDKIVYGGWNRVYLYPDGHIAVSAYHSITKMIEVAKDLGIALV